MNKNMFNCADKPTLLIVDDERNFTESLRLAIEDAFTVTVAGSLESARLILRDTMPTSILLDLRLPDGEGVELLRELKQFSRLPVVIVMTAFKTPESVVKALNDGAVDYFTKPLDIPKLKSVLRAELKKRKLCE